MPHTESPSPRRTLSDHRRLLNLVADGDGVVSQDLLALIKRVISYEPPAMLWGEAKARKDDILQRRAAGQTRQQIASEMNLPVRSVTNVLNRYGTADIQERFLANRTGERHGEIEGASTG